MPSLLWKPRYGKGSVGTSHVEKGCYITGRRVCHTPPLSADVHNIYPKRGNGCLDVESLVKSSLWHPNCPPKGRGGNGLSLGALKPPKRGGRGWERVTELLLQLNDFGTQGAKIEPLSNPPPKYVQSE